MVLKQKEIAKSSSFISFYNFLKVKVQKNRNEKRQIIILHLRIIHCNKLISYYFG